MEAFGSVKMHGTIVFIFFGLMILNAQVFALSEACKLHDSLNTLLIKDDAMKVLAGGGAWGGVTPLNVFKFARMLV